MDTLEYHNISLNFSNFESILITFSNKNNIKLNYNFAFL